MRLVRSYLVATALLACTQPVMAKSWLLKSEGPVTYLNVQNGLDNNLVALNDTVQFEISFNTREALAAGPVVSTPDYNVYNIVDAEVSLKVGSFTRSFSAGESLLSVLLANNWDFGVGPVDYQTFTIERFSRSGPQPFGLGDGNYSEWMSLNAFDASGQLRSDTSLANLTATSQFSASSFSYNFFSSSGSFPYIQFGSGALRWTISSVDTAPVPEAPSWAMLIGGFGLLGAATRRRKLNVTYA